MHPANWLNQVITVTDHEGVHIG